MNTLRTLVWITSFAGVSACATVGLDGDANPAHPDLESKAGAKTPSSADVPTTQIATASRSSDCEGTVGTELWRRVIDDDDPLVPTTVKSDASRNIFVASAAGALKKINSAGEPLWVRPFGSVVDVDTAGGVYVAGTFSGDFAVSNTTLSSAGGSDAYVAKLDEDGAVIFAVALGGTGDENGEFIAAAVGGVVVSGTGLGTVKLDDGGHIEWTSPLEGPVAVDASGNVLSTGALVGSAIIGGETIVSAGGEDVLVVKLGPDGVPAWSRRYGDASDSQRGESIAVDRDGSVIVGGVVEGSVDFGGGPVTVPDGTCPSEVSCKKAGFVLKLDPGGNFAWSRAEVPAVAVSGVAVDGSGNVYASGSYPGGVPPYRTPLIAAFDASGSDRTLPAYYDFAGLGHGIATDACGDVVFTFTTPGESSGDLGRAYVAKLLVP